MAAAQRLARCRLPRCLLLRTFFILYNVAIGYTTAARASLALSTLPLQTMVVGALLGIEPLSTRKTIGVLIAMSGVFTALLSGLSKAPVGAWRGELIMTAAVLCMAFYSVWSRPLMLRSSPLGYLTVGMGAGAAALVLFGTLTSRVAVVLTFNAAEWVAGIYLGAAGGAIAFILWVLALARTTPTRVANTMTVNPIAASLVATKLVDEPITPNLIIGLVAVFQLAWLASLLNSPFGPNGTDPRMPHLHIKRRVSASHGPSSLWRSICRRTPRPAR